MNENLMSSKFIISMVCLFLVSIGFFLGKITATEYMPFVLGILGTYTVGNTISKFADPKSAN